MFETFGDNPLPDYNYFIDAFRFVENDLEIVLHVAEGAKKNGYMAGILQIRGICYKMRSEYGLFRHYYKDYAIPAAETMSARLERDYQKVKGKGKYHGFVEFSGYFDSPLRDVIHAGYVTINHKIESFHAFVKARANGKAHGPMDANPATIRKPLFEELLRDRYDIHLTDFLAKEPASPNLCDECGKTKLPKIKTPPRPLLYPRIERIRLIANRVKHDSGYPKSVNDPLIQSLFEQEVGKPIKVPVLEFKLDMAYADAYLFMLANLIISACEVDTLEYMLSKPLKQGQEKYRPKIEEIAQNYRNQLDSFVKEYKNKRIDKLQFVLD
jgi:hypothetical protein